MVDFVSFGIVVDDIVFHNGQTHMGLLGGGGPQSAFGMRLWSESVGLSARVGSDLPASALEWLNNTGIDLQGVQTSELATPRAWQILESDGRRTQVWRVAQAVIRGQLSRSLEDLPQSYRSAHGFHYGVHPAQPDLDVVTGLQGLGGTVSIEPFKEAEPGMGEEQAARLLQSVDVFSPNYPEAASLVGEGNPPDLLRRMGRLGGRVLALRLGAQGSLLTSDSGVHSIHIPAIPVKCIDPVGAGNAYCGGFLVGWCMHRDLRIAGHYGTVAASFLLEQPGLPGFTPLLQDDAFTRLKWLSEQS